MKESSTLLNYIFFSVGFFIIIPNSLKELPFIALGIFSIYIYLKNKNLDSKLFFIMSLFFIINILSLLYTTDLQSGISRITGFLPFLYLPFSYCVLIKTNLIINKSFFKNWIIVFNFSILLFLIIFMTYFHSLPVRVTYNNLRTVLDKMPFINMHPIYVSIITFLGILTNLYFFNKNKLLAIFFIFTNFFLLFVSGARATLIALIILIFSLFFISKISFIKKTIIFFFILLCVGLTFTLNSDLVKRYREIILSTSYMNLNVDNSTSVRFAIWNCAFQQVKNTNILIGNGVGDVPNKLQACYDDKYPNLGKYYNSHNQYLSIILSVGLFGIFAFFIFIIYVYKNSGIHKNLHLLIVLLFYLYLFLFENVLERKYGILMFLFFSLFVFNLFTKKLQSNNNLLLNAK